MSNKIDWTLSNKQIDAWKYLTDNKTRYVGYGGGARGGKTRLGCMWVYAMCCQYPGITMFIGRKTLVDLRRTTVVEFMKMIKDSGASNCSLYNNSEIRFNNGSKVLLLDLAYQPSDPHSSSLDGLVLQGGLIDEANEVNDNVISTLYTRIMADNRYPDLYPKILETFNPDKGRVYSKYYSPFISKSLPENTIFIPALAKDNPFCEKGYVQSILDSGDELAIQRKVYGNFEYDDDPDVLCSYADINKCFVNVDANKIQVGIKYLSVDIAASGRDKTVLIAWDGLKILEVYSEDITTDRSLEGAIKNMIDKYNIRIHDIVMDASGVGALIPSKYIGSVGFNGGGRSFDYGFKNLRSQCYYKLAQYIREAKIDLSNAGRYSDIIKRELATIKRDRRETDMITIQSKDSVKDYLGHSPDFADALMMRMYFEFVKNNIFIK